MKSPPMPIFPSGELIEETRMPASARMRWASASWASSRSRMFVSHAERNSIHPIPSSRSTRTCSLRSGEISSAKPDRVHIEGPFTSSGGVSDSLEATMGPRDGLPEIAR